MWGWRVVGFLGWGLVESEAHVSKGEMLALEMPCSVDKATCPSTTMSPSQSICNTQPFYSFLGLALGC